MLTPLDIHKKEFRRVFRGYDEEQVDSFLDQVIMDYEKLYRDNQELKERLKRTEGSMAQYQEMEEVLKNTLVMAQKNADELRKNTESEVQLMMEKAREKAYRTVNRAEQEAREILSRAEQQASKLVSEAEKRVRQLLDRYEEIEKQVQVFRIKFKSLLEAELQLLEREEELFAGRINKTSDEMRREINGLEEKPRRVNYDRTGRQEENGDYVNSREHGMQEKNGVGEIPAAAGRTGILGETGAGGGEVQDAAGRDDAPGEIDADEMPDAADNGAPGAAGEGEAGEAGEAIEDKASGAAGGDGENEDAGARAASGSAMLYEGAAGGDDEDNENDIAGATGGGQDKGVNMHKKASRRGFGGLWGFAGGVDAADLDGETGEGRSGNSEAGKG